MSNNTPISIVCFGEVLWDVLPQGRKPGGAPLNVAYHLKRLGVNSSIISRIGDDEAGKKLLQLMQEWKVDAQDCQVDRSRETGSVLTSVEDSGEVDYDILFPVAWDFIQWEEHYRKKVANADAFVFGSLIMRNAVSQKTLHNLLSAARYRVFDVNLRPPHYTPDQVLPVLQKTNLLKLNRHELAVLTGWMGHAAEQEENGIKLIQKNYGIAEVLLTKGKDGAIYYKDDKRYESPAYQVEVVDTVGSGDAFLAAFLAGRSSKESLTVNQQLRTAAALGALVASKSGACPPYHITDLDNLINQ